LTNESHNKAFKEGKVWFYLLFLFAFKIKWQKSLHCNCHDYCHTLITDIFSHILRIIS
jgi:hypothetical protein